MLPRRSLALLIWLLSLVACVAIILQTPFRTDMAAFLPRSASPAERALTDQVRNGVASRLILIGIQGASAATLAQQSKFLTAHLRHDPEFAKIDNGDDKTFSVIRKYFWRHRYMLSPDVVPREFTASGLRAALKNDLDLLTSDMGTLTGQAVPADPTGVGLAMLQSLAVGAKGPRRHNGVWFSADGKRVLLLIYTRAAGFDIDAQEHALTQIRNTFRESQQAVPHTSRTRLLESGPGVFSVRMRHTIQRDVTWLSLLAMAVVVSLLMFTYRSPRVLLLGVLPVVTGALAGIAAVFLGFGYVHGITLGFGVSLIGESVDYAIYTFTQTARNESVADTLTNIWPTLCLGALTSIVGFSVMLFSSVVGFAQLGLFSIAGLVAAACVTRFVLPTLAPDNFFAPGARILGWPVLVVIKHRRNLRPVIGLLLICGIVLLVLHRGGFWVNNLSHLNPIPANEQTLDHELRNEIGVPSLRYFVVFRTRDKQSALKESGAVARALRKLVTQHLIGGFHAPSQILPSKNAQRERQAALPDPKVLRKRFAEAETGLPFRRNTFTPFFHAVASERKAPMLTRRALPTTLQLELDSMLIKDAGQWEVIMPLRDVTDPGRVAAKIAASGQPGVKFVDLKRATHQLLQTYQHEATLLASIGSLAIFGLLCIGLRLPARILAVTAPLAASVIVTAALLTIGGRKLSIFMVVGFLLIVAVSSNYCLFFERQYLNPDDQRRSIGSIVLANLCTVSAYGLMALSGIPVLHDIGVTVAFGTALCLFFSAILSTRSSAELGTTQVELEAQRTLPRKEQA